MKIHPTKLAGVFIIENDNFHDERGSFVKVFHEDIFTSYGLESSFKESFYSVSKKDVIRGMHFHLPPKDHTKLVYVTHGALIDVVLDIRENSKTYGEYVTTKLTSDNNTMVYIPTGFAHGFLSLENDTCMTYLQTGVYSKEHDAGIEVNSFGFDWGIKKPILSLRDTTFPTLKEFKTPFK